MNITQFFLDNTKRSLGDDGALGTQCNNMVCVWQSMNWSKLEIVYLRVKLINVPEFVTIITVVPVDVKSPCGPSNFVKMCSSVEGSKPLITSSSIIVSMRE